MQEPVGDAKKKASELLYQTVEPGSMSWDDIYNLELPKVQTFQEKLMEYIIASGKSSPSIYNDMSISKQTFSKMQSDADADTIKRELIASMQKWGHKYPDAGYGCRFSGWLRAKNPKPYNSCGNGSAMRVFAAGWLYDSLERTREVAALTAAVTHNHSEGIKAAEATAAAIFMARNGASKEKIKDYIVREFHYDLSRTCDEIRPGYYHIELAQKTVPEAITAFLESENFEDAIRTVVSLGGDTDTLGA